MKFSSSFKVGLLTLLALVLLIGVVFKVKGRTFSSADRVEIKFKDSDNIFRIEQIYNNGIQKFINLYSNLNFKCTKIEYHKKTNLISYMYFEEV